MAKQKKGIIKKVVIGATILIGLVGISYTAVPQAKEAIDDTINKIVDTFKGEGINKLEELEAVTNIAFDEASHVLTFDENVNARSYIVNVRHKGSSYAIEAQAGVVQIPAHNVLMNGDVITFEVIAVGDGINTKNSQGIKIEHTIELANDAYYNLSKKSLEDFLDKATRLFGEFRVVSFYANSMNVEGNYFIIDGTGKSGAGNDVNFSLKFDMTGYKKTNSTDFSDLNNYRHFLNYMSNNATSKNVTIEAEFADEYIDMTNILENGGAFDEYIEDGYTIEVLQHSNSRIFVENGVSYVTYSGIYRAVHDSKESITFKQENKIAIESEKEYLSMEEFLNDASAQAVVTIENEQIYDQVLNEHLIKTLEADTSKVKTTSSSMGREQ